MIEIFLLGILTGLMVALLAIYSYSRITAGGAEAASKDTLTATIIKEQPKLLGQALRRRRYLVVVIIQLQFNFITAAGVLDLPPSLVHLVVTGGKYR